MNHLIERRDLLRAGALGAAGLSLTGLFPAWAQTGSAGLSPNMPTLTGQDLHLKVDHSAFAVGGRTGHAITMNGVLPAPLIRLKEGQKVRISVENALDEDTSIHWHGLILPFQMDGVPGVSFPGIKPKTTFVYEFPIKQSGTYWYHSHSGLQEQQGHYGPIVIDPADTDPVAYDREHVIVLSDWTFLHPHALVTKLKQEGGYFNRQKQTLAGLLRDGDPEEKMSLSDRLMWGKMRMDPSDISDVTASTYTYLINGHGPKENWTGLFRPGERVRLRFINAATMTIFNIRIPGLPMTVVNADGQNVRPVTVEEFQIGNAETYDVIIQPTEDSAFTLVAESIDRSGMGRATFAPRLGMTAPVPPLRPRPTLSMKDMGMGGMDHGSMAGMDHSSHGAAATAGATASMAGMDHGSSGSMGGMNMRDKSLVPPTVKVGVGVDAIAMAPVDRTGDPGLGLEDVGHKVLTYRDLMSLTPNPDKRAPTRTVEVHLTGNMERFMWSFDGEKFSEGVEPIRFERNERARVVLINHSMMTHPIHLHGHFFEVVNGHTGSHPLKHTVNVLPGAKLTFDLTADAPGDWAFHCHLLLHMHAGMFRVVTVRPLEGEAA
ncbi:copper resistance system multicopper oxidase [Sphingomonas koreensis]|jgi:CopA family copper-resistance protein|uniref:Copper resistance system multicopper oxidase n=1 Tax=Sphingomonas koreensis TaxID=93064 RepID=A0A430FXJ9_9SPHN|nr:MULTISPECIES: copper resistance system multicopper oxidase [Sphingomonas]ARS28238.1 copper resistance protein CopA [Sphingomonas sp. KC8]MDK2770401.1 copper resistance system multicopper oxidase [Sphingomonas sp.]RSY76352.1 copper resistance system multicopper oxidase [Sphingomonas koreensis]